MEPRITPLSAKCVTIIETTRSAKHQTIRSWGQQMTGPADPVIKQVELSRSKLKKKAGKVAKWHCTVKWNRELFSKTRQKCDKKRRTWEDCDNWRKYNFKKFKMKMLTVMALLMLSMKSVTGLRCYTCNSHFDPLCGDPFFDHLGEVPTIFFVADNWHWQCTCDRFWLLFMDMQKQT